MPQEQPLELEIHEIDHLGIIAGIVDEIGIVEIINGLLGSHPQEEVSAGHVVKALILNCLGFLTAPLYLFSQFFQGKATEHLIGPGVKPEYLNDSRIGRVLDQLYKIGITRVFVQIALAAVLKFDIDTSRAHLDGSSMYVHGQYLQSEPPTPPAVADSDQTTPTPVDSAPSTIPIIPLPPSSSIKQRWPYSATKRADSFWPPTCSSSKTRAKPSCQSKP